MKVVCCFKDLGATLRAITYKAKFNELFNKNQIFVKMLVYLCYNGVLFHIFERLVNESRSKKSMDGRQNR